MDDMKNMKIFVPITKIDAAQRLVYGVVTAEQPDVSRRGLRLRQHQAAIIRSGRKNSPSATDGKSFGNLRAMHANVAAGKLVEIAFNDEHKRIEICGKVVDDAEWQKVEEGVYTGFSQGGRYLKRWPDPDEPALMRYTAEPLEVSLVDHPCLPEATFAVIKADGSTELRKFKARRGPRGRLDGRNARGHGKQRRCERIRLARSSSRQGRRSSLQGRQGAHQKDARSFGRARSRCCPGSRRARCACRAPPAIFPAGG